MTRWLSSEEQAVWRRWLEVSARTMDAFDKRLQASSKLALTDYEILVMLSESPERKARMSELAERVLVSRSRLTYRVDRLVERGFVTREECEDDKRGLNALLTDEGFSLLETAAPKHVEDVRTVLLDHITPAELDTLDTILTKVQSGLADEA